MENRDFDEFLRRQQADAAAAAAINWNRRRDEWLAYLRDLYAKIESLLSRYVASGQIRFEYRPIQLNELNIGSYTAKEMVLRIGRQEVVLKPIGTLIIGFRGRVDVEGPGGTAQIALVDRKASSTASLIQVHVGPPGTAQIAPKKKRASKDEKISEVIDALDGNSTKWAWRIVTRPPERRFIEITQQALFRLIMEVANA